MKYAILTIHRKFSGGFKMRELYKKVEEYLDSIDFDSIWTGFSRFNFALYNKSNVYLKNEVILYDHRFSGNTSIEYNGEFIAIWHVDNPLNQDSQLLASDLVHEMFHAFQRTHNENRFPSDLTMLNYPENIENFTIRHSENLLLANAFLADNINVKKAYLDKFISARKYRESIIGDMIKQEYYTETIEGMAEYAGSMALKQFSHEKFINRVNGYIENLQILDERFFDTRRMLYYTGAVFCILLSEIGMNLYHKIGETKNPLFYIVAESFKAEKPSIEFDNKLLSLKTEKYLNDKKLRFEKFFQSHSEETSGDFIICGYDPMNMIKMDDMILCSHFIMLKSENSDESVFIQGPVIVNLKMDSFNEVKSYFK